MTKQPRPAIGVVVAVLALFAILTGCWFIDPTYDDPRRADAILVLGGGGDRVDHGIELADEGVADVVVFASPFVEDEGVWAARPCNTRPAGLRDEVEIRCQEPDPGDDPQ